MYDENQLVKLTWNNANIKWFKSKGYNYTKMRDEFFVKAKDLMPNSAKQITVICDYCGEEYTTQYAIITNGRKSLDKDACPHCAGKKASEISKNKRAKKYIGMVQKVCEENGYILLTTEDEYTDVKMDVHFVCPKHGEQTMMLDNFLRGHKCSHCSYEGVGNILKHDIQYVKECIEDINGNKLLNPEDYKDAHAHNLNILCSCGNIFTTSFSSYMRYGVNTCFSCSCKESDGEKIIRKFLESHNINFEQEKRFEDCRDVRPLPFDFYLPEYNLIIEFDGQHHFEENHNRGNYEITKRHDEIKNRYCKDKNINLLRIPYWEGNNIENIITKKLNL